MDDGDAATAPRMPEPGGCEPYDDGAGAVPPDHADEPPEPEWALYLSEQFDRERLAAAGTDRPGAWSAEILQRYCPDGTANPVRLDAAALVDGIAGLQRLIGWAQASQQRYLAALARPGVAAPIDDVVDLAASPLGMAQEVPDVPTQTLLSDPTWGPAIARASIAVAGAQVGCALNMSPRTARGRTEQAVAMVDTLPATLAAQEAGDIDSYRAAIIHDRSRVLDPRGRRRLERAVLRSAGTRTPSRLRDIVDRHVTRIDPAAAARREQEARHGRGVRTQSGEDGMGVVRADVAAPDAQLTMQVLDRIAAAVQSAGLSGGRGRSQIRADVFIDLFRELAATGQTSIGGPGRATTSTGTSTRNSTNASTSEPDTGTGSDGGANPAASGNAVPGTAAPGNNTAPDSARRSTDRQTHHDAAPTTNAGNNTAPDNARRSTDRQTHHDAAPTTNAGNNAASDNAAPEEAAPTTTNTSGGVDTQTHGGPTHAGAAPDSGSADRAADTVGGTDTDTATPVAQAAADRASGHRPGTRWTMPVCMNVYVAASTLAGWDDEPAELAGHGVISADFARALVESAAVVRTIAVHPPREQQAPPGGPEEWTPAGHSTDPVRSRWCGSVLDAGRSVYRARKSLADNVVARDRTCQFPGCRAAGTKCDLDHRLPWHSGGATCPCNQDSLCRFHHLIKTFTSWTATPGPDGALMWTSPTGRCYHTEPGHLLMDGPGVDNPVPAGQPDNALVPRAPDADEDPPPF